MIMDADKQIKKQRASVFDQHREEVKKYIQIGISLRTIHKIICSEMKHTWSYDGFYKWVVRTGLRG